MILEAVGTAVIVYAVSLLADVPGRVRWRRFLRNRQIQVRCTLSFPVETGFFNSEEVHVVCIRVSKAAGLMEMSWWDEGELGQPGEFFRRIGGEATRHGPSRYQVASRSGKPIAVEIAEVDLSILLESL